MTHDFKKLLTEDKYFAPNFEIPEESDLDSFFKDFYGQKRYMIGDDANYDAARGDVDKLCQYMSGLGFAKANDLKDKFSSINVSNAKEGKCTPLFRPKIS